MFFSLSLSSTTGYQVHVIINFLYLDNFVNNDIRMHQLSSSSNTSTSYNTNTNHYFTSMNNQTSKISPPPITVTTFQQQQQQLTPNKTIKFNLIQSPLPIGSFKLGTIAITHQSSPYINNLNNNNKHLQQQQNDCDCDDEEKPKIFQVEDSVVVPIATTTTTAAPSKCESSLNISSPSLSNSGVNDTSFLSNQTKSSLKTATSQASSNTSNNNKHVKFFTDNIKQQQQIPETPIMFSRCSSMTSLNSFDAKSIHSSVASEYSRRPSGIMSPSELPDSPDESYVMSLRLAQQQQQQQRNNESKSNEITIIERTILDKNSFYSIRNDCNDDDEDVPFIKENTTLYDTEGSPWRTRAHSEVSSLSALTFNDDLSEHKIASNKDLAAILSLLQTRSKEKQQQQQQQHHHQQYQQQMVNFNTLNFTPPIKLPANKQQMNTNNQMQQQSYYFSNNMPTSPPLTQQQQQQQPLCVDIPKLYCDEYTPSNISPQSGMSDLSVPSLIKQDIQTQKSQFNCNTNFDALFKRMSFNAINSNSSCSHKNEERLEVIDLEEVPKVYKTEDNSNSGSVDHESSRPQNQQFRLTVSSSHVINNNNNNTQEVESPKIFLTEDTPMCYSRSSSLNSLNNDSTTNNNQTAIKIKRNSNEECDKLNKSTSILLSDSCNKPTNTPAFANMSRASYASQNDTEDDEDDDLENNKENNNREEDEDDDEDEIEDEEEEDDDEDKKENENLLINQFINQTMPVTINKQFKTIKSKPNNNSPSTTVNNNKENTNNSNIDDDDEALLQNFIKEMLPPVPTRQSISKLPVLKRSSLATSHVDDKSFIVSRAPVVSINLNKCKKRLSEENPSGVHSNKVQQHNRNFSICYNLASSTHNNNNLHQQQQQSPKLNKKVPNLTLTKTNCQLNALNLNKNNNNTRMRLSGATHAASTCSLSTLTTTTTATTSTASSSSSNSVNTNGQHHHPIVNMTRTSQLRASKMAETKSSELVRKTMASRPPIASGVSTSKTSATQSQRLPTASKTSQTSTNIPNLKLNLQHEQHVDVPDVAMNFRRKSFNGPSSSSSSSNKKQPTSTRCTNENQVISSKTTTSATIGSTVYVDNAKNVLKKTNLNKFNK